MSEKKSSTFLLQNPLLFRYSPNSRFNFGAFSEHSEIESHPEIFGDSITDKESYRLNLSSMRGALASGTPQANHSTYMFEDGVYDLHKDFSVLFRKDLSIVDIDNITNRLKEQLETSDELYKKEIESQLEAYNKKKSDLISSQKSDSSNQESNSSE